jgi:hypothetical protein
VLGVVASLAAGNLAAEEAPPPEARAPEATPQEATPREAEPTQPTPETPPTPSAEPLAEEAPPPVAESPEVPPEEPVVERVPAETGIKKRIAYSVGQGCEPRPEGVTQGWSLILEFVGGEGDVCGVKLVVRDIKGKTLFSEKSVASPWIYLDLRTGGYEVRAKRKGGRWKSLSTQTIEGKVQRGRIFFEMPSEPVK